MAEIERRRGMSAYTPGPWQVYNKRADIDRGYEVSDWADIETEYGRVIGSAYLCDEETNNANARLFAAAPELLAALERLVSYASPTGISIEDYDHSLMQARAAIAKAHGEQS